MFTICASNNNYEVIVLMLLTWRPVVATPEEVLSRDVSICCLELATEMLRANSPNTPEAPRIRQSMEELPRSGIGCLTLDCTEASSAQASPTHGVTNLSLRRSTLFVLP